MAEGRETNETRPAEPAPGEEDAELDAAAIAALLKGGDPAGDAPAPAEPAPEEEDGELDAAAIAALLKGDDPAGDAPRPAEPAPEEEDGELDAAAIAALLKGGDPAGDAPRPAAEPALGDDELVIDEVDTVELLGSDGSQGDEARPGEPAPGGEDEELDAAAVAALLRGGDPDGGDSATASRSGGPPPPDGAEPCAPDATSAERASEPAEVFLDLQLTPVTEPKEELPAEDPAARAATGPSWLTRAVQGLRERWADLPARAARLAAVIREGTARVRRALERSAEKEARAPEPEPAAAEPEPVEEPAHSEPEPVEEPAPAQVPEEREGKGSEAQPRTARLVLVPLCVNTAAMVALLAVLVVSPQLAVRARAAARAREDAAMPAPASPRRPPPPGPTLQLGEFVVLLRDGAGETESGREHYARVAFELELPDERAREAASSRLPLFRDAVLSYLGDRTAEELLGSEAQRHVKAALGRRFSEAAPNVRVRAILFTDLVVQ